MPSEQPGNKDINKANDVRVTSRNTFGEELDIHREQIKSEQSEYESLSICLL